MQTNTKRLILVKNILGWYKLLKEIREAQIYVSAEVVT